MHTEEMIERYTHTQALTIHTHTLCLLNKPLKPKIFLTQDEENTESFTTQSDSGLQVEERSWPLIGQLAAAAAVRLARPPETAAARALTHPQNTYLRTYTLVQHSHT